MSRNNNVFFDVAAPVTADDICQIETQLGVSFPGEFKTHYLRYNGGSPERCLLQIDDSEFVVQEFFPLRYGDVGDRLEDICDDLQNVRQILPKHLVPFADDPGGDFFCISIDTREVGAIFHFCCDYYDDPSRAARYLTATLSEFVNRLVTE